MRRLGIAAALVLTCALPARAEWQPPGKAEAALFVASEVLVLYDGLQTLDLRNHPGRTETNFLMPARPSQGRSLPSPVSGCSRTASYGTRCLPGTSEARTRSA